jgi:endonuclease/exonuclease/phosphatase (EEP) superfamily protein YafD
MQVAVCAMCAALFGCELAYNYTDPAGPRYDGAYADDPLAASRLPQLKSVTFNIQFSKKFERAAAELESVPALAEPDVLLLQEMDALGADAIAAALGRNYVYYPGSIQHGRDFGNAVLSRWPITHDEKILLPHKSPADGRIRIAVCATLQTPLGDVRAYSVHTETPWLGPRGRLEQAEVVLRHARASELPTIIAGDFNTGDPGSLDATVDMYGADGFVWASRNAGDSLGTLDVTFMRQLVPRDSGNVATAASDHRPQWVDAELSPPL